MATGSTFDGSATLVRQALPASKPATGDAASTIVVVARRTSNSGAATRYAACLEDAADSPVSIGLAFSTTDLLRHPGSVSVNTSTLGATTADAWVSVAWSKAAGGAAVPRGHKYIHATATASHENATGTPSPTGTVPAELIVGRFATAGTANAAVGSYRAVVVYNTALSDADCVTAMASYAGALSLGPSSMLVFDGTNTPVEVVAGSAVNVSGSAFTSDATAIPALWATPIGPQAQPTVNDLRVELFLKSDPLWSNITDGVRMADGVRINRGRTSEDGESSPSSCSLTLDNLAGRYSPRNTSSSFYGRIGRNTPLRVGFGKPVQGATQTGTGATVTYPQVAGSNGYGATAVLAVAVAVPVDTLSTPAGYTGAAETDAAAFTIKRSRSTDADVLPSTTSTASGTPTAWTTCHLAVPGGTYVAAGTGTGDAGLGPGGISLVTVGVGDLVVAVVSWSADVRGRMQPPWMASGLDPAEMYMICDSGPGEGPRVAAYAWEHRSGHSAVNFFGALDGVTGSSLTIYQYTGQAKYTPRFCGEVSDWPVTWSKDENNKPMPIEAGGVSRRLSQSQDQLSQVRAAFAGAGDLTHYWPLEDPAGAEDFAPAIGTSRMTPSSGISAGAVEAFAGSMPTPDFTGRGARGVIPANPAPFGFGCLAAIPAAGTATGSNIIFGTCSLSGSNDVATVGLEYTSNTALTFKVQYDTGATASTSLGSLTGLFPDGVNGQQFFVYLSFAQSGADVAWGVSLINITPTGGYLQLSGGSTLVAHTLGALGQITIGLESGTGASLGTNELSMGHAFVTPGSTFVEAVSRTYAARAYDAATVIAAAQSQAQLGGVPFTFTYPDTETITCSANAPGDLMARLRTLAFTGQALMQDAAGFPGLEWRPLTTIISRPAGYTFDYAGATFTDPFYPVDDDAITLNDATVTNPLGSMARVQVEIGPLGAQPGGIGRYADSFTAPSRGVPGARDLAGWVTSQGTFDVARWPYVGLRMNGAGNAALQMPRFSIGDTVALSNLPSFAGPTTASLIVIGMIEEVDEAQWTLTLVTRPAGPYRVLIWDNATFGVWADTTPAATDNRWGM